MVVDIDPACRTGKLWFPDDDVWKSALCEQGDKRLLALKVEPYNLLLFGEEACVPELLRFLFDGGYEIKNYLCASELGYVLMREMQPYGRCYEEALAMDFMEARRVTEPSAPEVEPARCVPC